MLPELLDIVLGAAWLAWLFFTGLFLPVVLQLFLLFFAGWALFRLAYRAWSTIARLLSLIGTPLHELAHALGSLITLCGVAAIKLHSDEAGVASVWPKRWNPVGQIVGSLAPLFVGVLVLWLTAVYIIPGFEVPDIPPPQFDLESAASLGTVLRETLDFLAQILLTAYQKLPDLQWDNWRTYVGLYIALSVGIGIAPSRADLGILLGGLFTAGVLIFGLLVLLYLSGDALTTFAALQEALWPSLIKFSIAVTTAFVLASLGVLIFLPLYLLKMARQASE